MKVSFFRKNFPGEEVWEAGGGCSDQGIGEPQHRGAAGDGRAGGIAGQYRPQRAGGPVVSERSVLPGGEANEED